MQASQPSLLLSNQNAPQVNPPLLNREASSFPNTPQGRINKFVLALLAVCSAAVVAAGVYLSVKALVILGSVSCVFTAVAIIFNFSSSASSQSPKNVNKAGEVLDLINTNTPGAQSSITSVSFWKELTKDEEKKAIIKAWLAQRKLLELIPFEKLDPSLIVLAYEVIKENPTLTSLEDFCRRYRCQELIDKMTIQELYLQEGHNVMMLFSMDQAGETKQPKYLKGENRFGLDWEQWEKFKNYHPKFILCILLDLHDFPDEKKRKSVNYFVANLFKKIDRINLNESKMGNLFGFLYITRFDFVKFSKQINNLELAKKYSIFLKDMASNS